MALAMKNAGVGGVAVAPHQRRDSLVLHPWSMPPSAVVLGQNQQEEKPLEEWYQPLWHPCKSPTIMAYSMFCCCCAMGDIGCYTRKRFLCYIPYCLCAWCPCCLGLAREVIAENLNLPVSEVEPSDWTWCIAKLIGMRVLCFFTVCLFPCIHVTQMRAELAYRRHGDGTLCPCCCLECGDQKDVTLPGGPKPPPRADGQPESPGYPRQIIPGANTTTTEGAKPSGSNKFADTVVSGPRPVQSQPGALASHARALTSHAMYSQQQSRVPALQGMFQQSRSLSSPNLGMFGQGGVGAEALAAHSMFSSSPGMHSAQHTMFGSQHGAMGHQYNYYTPQTAQHGAQMGQYGVQPGHFGAQAGLFGSQTSQYETQGGQYGMYQQPYGAQTIQAGYPDQSAMYGPQPSYGVQQQMMQR